MKRSLNNLATLLCVVVAGGCASSATTQAPPSPTPSPSGGVSLSIISPAAGAVVRGDTADLRLALSGITLVKADGDTSGRTGHFHVFIDKAPVAPGEIIPTGPGIVHSATNPVQLTGLSAGDHTLIVVLGDGVHRRIAAVQAQTSLMVTGPSVQLSAPARVDAGQPVTVTVDTQGVRLVKGAEDTSNKDGSSGHLHIFVNKEPGVSGTVIPSGDPAIIHTAATTTVIPATLLNPGANTIWVQLGYADHTPFDPPVVDKVVITVVATPNSSPTSTVASPS